MSAVIAIIDDDAAVRRSLCEVLTTYGFKAVEFRSGNEFLKSDVSPNCILLDVRMPGMDGLEVQRQLRRQHAAVPTIFITGHGDIPLAVRAMRAGAFDFIEKPVRDEILTQSIESAIRNVGDEKIAEDEAAAFGKRVAKLTSREFEVMTLVVEGFTSTAIGAKLDISSRTADHHRARILEKLGAVNVANLIRLVLRHSKSGGPHGGR